MPKKPILLVDFDGVIHSYTSGWQGADIVPDDPVPGALDFLRNATELFRVSIYSSRSNQPGGIDAMKEWIEYHALSEDLSDRKWCIDAVKEWIEYHTLPEDLSDRKWWKKLHFPMQKPAAFLTIDDRCFCFTGIWPDLQELLAFKPWNKK